MPRGGEVVLSLQRLRDITVDAAQGEAIVGAGAILEDVQHAAANAGWEVGVDLSSRGSCTIGGMVATNAGGEHVLRYGPMADQIIGVEAALADGSLVGRVPALRKDNTGYHWPGLLAGSEGTLGGHHAGAPAAGAAPYPTASCAARPRRPERGAGRLLRPAPRPGALESALEVCSADGIDLVRTHFGLPAPFTPPAPVVLLAECAQRDGDPDELVEQLGTIVTAASERAASGVAVDDRNRSRFWEYREGYTEAINAAGIPHKLDVTLPFDRLVEFEPAVRDRVERVAPGARVILFGPHR